MKKVLSVLLALVLVLSFSLVTALPVAAVGPIGDPFFTTNELGTVEWSTEQKHSGDYSAKLWIPAFDSNRLYDEARVVFNYDGDLSSIAGVSFWSYVIGGNEGTLYPFVVLAVDRDADLDVDSWVVQWAPLAAHTPLQNDWEQISFGGGSPVHVAGDTTGLPEGHYKPYTTEYTETDTLNVLRSETGWADFTVLEVKVMIGEFTNLTDTMTAYIDDVIINDVTYDLEPPAITGESTFTVANGTYVTTMITTESGIIEAVLTGGWGESSLLGDFTATGTGDLYITGMYPDAGTTATISVRGGLSEHAISFSGTAVRIEGDDISNDEITGILGTLTIYTDGSFVAALTGNTAFAAPYDTVVIGISGSISMLAPSGSVGLHAYTEAPQIGISVDPGFVDFLEVIPGTPASGDLPVTVTNEGNVDVDLSTTIENDWPKGVYTAAVPNGLTIGGDHVSDWFATVLVDQGTGPLPLALTVPDATPPGTYSAVLVFWAEPAAIP